MRFFRWNSFTVIGLILVVIGAYGLLRGAGFEFDSGLPAEPREGFYYILVGVLMIVNGCIVPSALAEPAAKEPSADSPDSPARSSKAGAPARTE
jgi:hypothetical protein